MGSLLADRLREAVADEGRGEHFLPRSRLDIQSRRLARPRDVGFRALSAMLKKWLQCYAMFVFVRLRLLKSWL